MDSLLAGYPINVSSTGTTLTCTLYVCHFRQKKNANSLLRPTRLLIPYFTKVP